MTKAINYAIEITHGNSSVTDEDRYRAEAAIDAAIKNEGITDNERFRAMLLAFLARTEGEPHDAALADAYERIQAAGDVALTEGWHNPNGAGLSVYAYL